MSELPVATRPRLEIGTPQHFRWLEGIVRTVLVLNLADALFTLVWIRSALASEANPLLRDLAHGHPAAFVGVKTALVGLASWLFWRHRQRPLAVVAIFLAFGVYYALLLAHLGFLSLVVRGAALIP
jgi:formate hydrogenlyase subunit 3/multisubunit Na+/H+ antiporter MnhD subunit